MDLLLEGGTVIGPGGGVVADVRIVDGKIAEIGTRLGGAGVRTLDCTGCWVGPGLVDLHVHLREPGHEHKEDIATGSAAAAAGGYTAVVAMPNTDPAIDSVELVRFVRDKGRAVGLVDVLPSAAITAGRAGRLPAPYEDLAAAGVRIFTDDGDTVADPELLRTAMERIAAAGGVVTQHAVDPVLAAGGHLHEESPPVGGGVGGIAGDAEAVIVARDLTLVRETGAPYHVQHLSSARSVELIAAAKAEGLPVTAEVTPHHLAFDYSALASADTHFKMMPPLGSPSDRRVLIDALRSGVIDAVATDHAPHAPHEKEIDIEQAAFGVIGLAEAAAVVHTVAGLDAPTFFERLSIAPAAIAGAEGHGVWPAPGAPANLTVFAPDRAWVPRRTVSRSRNSPYLGRQWKGRIVATILRGAPTYLAVEEVTS
jgi:dihydroorotase